MKPFSEQKYFEPTTIDKLFNRVPQKNFLIDVNNLLAQESLDRLSNENIRKLEEKHKITNSAKKFKEELNSFLGNFIVENLGNEQSDANDYASAKKFQLILGLPDNEFLDTYEPVALKVFNNIVSEILDKSHKYTDEEETKLEEFRTKINFEKGKAEKIINGYRQSIVQNYMDRIIADNRISPQEMDTFEKLCDDYAVTVSIDNKTKQVIEKCKALWTIEFGELPTVSTDIILQKNEVCYFRGKAKLYETRRVTKNITYQGFNNRIKITKSLSYRLGNVAVNRQTEDVVTLIDDGILNITNKRIIFNGNKQNKIIKYNQILDLDGYTDGVEISKETGKSPLFALYDESGEILTAIIKRAISDSKR